MRNVGTHNDRKLLMCCLIIVMRGSTGNPMRRGAPGTELSRVPAYLVWYLVDVVFRERMLWRVTSNMVGRRSPDLIVDASFQVATACFA
jgi:hypothetical protein